ncbi:unnamed protein product [Linum tenue]|uniref:ent-kaurene synthase n=1 Tax=Linum tenue TaxID=586396 RepID=A0AAV0LTB4_9ROSI|nr:unnamed protein product [Linum tenue]
MFVCLAGSQPPMSSTPAFPLVPAAIPAKCRESGSPLLATEFSNTNLLQSCDGSMRIQRIKKMFDEAHLSVSAYDTAWMAMVPTPTSSMEDSPLFPQCARWILDNQLSDGSWGLARRNPSSTKDALSSTLACILALQRWGLGEQQVTKGLQFLDCNSASLTDQKQHMPIGFDIIFTGMIDYAKDLGLNLPFKSTDVDAMLTKRNVELTSGFGRNAKGRRAYLAYVSEGIQHSQDWDMVMKYQRKNGSLFNSPSTTAVAFSHLRDPDCLRYLCAILDQFENAAPTIYPLDIRSHLLIIDTLDGLGVARHFTDEMKMLLDQTYRCWLQGDEEIFLDTTTCAMAFRLLRVYGYDVSSDQLSPFSEDCFFNSLEGYLNDKTAVLELHKASQIIYPEEPILEELNSWTMNFLKQEFCNGSIYVDQPGESISTDVHDALTYSYHVDLDRLGHRRSIDQHSNIDNTWTLKTYCSCPNIRNKVFLELAAEDFNLCQSIQQKELKQLGRWVIENKLDKLSFARQKLGHCHFAVAATLYAPELSDARISWAKNCTLVTYVDDFFDVEGSMEELVTLVQLIENWEVDGSTYFCSEQVEILFTAIRRTIHEIGDTALAWQARDVTHHIKDIWVQLLKSMLKEAEWSRNKLVPTMEEYMKHAHVTLALGPTVLPSLYLLGPKLSEEMVSSPEYKNLYEGMSTCGRFLNDTSGFQREFDEGTINAMSLLLLHEGDRSMDDAVEEVKRAIERERKQVLKLVFLEKEKEGIPNCCKQVFWDVTKVLLLFYLKDDGFTNERLVNLANSIVDEPICVSCNCLA